MKKQLESLPEPEVVEVQTKIIGEHRVFFYLCKRCQKKRQSYKKTVAHAGICRLCKKNKVPENQLTIFGIKFGRRKK